jgi:AhpD family alkylhydroperoxidase
MARAWGTPTPHNAAANDALAAVGRLAALLLDGHQPASGARDSRARLASASLASRRSCCDPWGPPRLGFAGANRFQVAPEHGASAAPTLRSLCALGINRDGTTPSYIVAGTPNASPPSAPHDAELQPGEAAMNRQQVFKQIEETFGFVPSFMKVIPESSLELEWQLMKRLQLDEGPIPNKYRELMGIGIAAATRCPYCVCLHTEMARLHGATDAEVEDALRFAKASSSLSTYLNGLHCDLKEFRTEIKRLADFLKMKQAGVSVVRPTKPDVSRHS